MGETFSLFASRLRHNNFIILQIVSANEFKVGIFLGEATLSISSMGVSLPLNGGQLLKERICSSKSKFFPLSTAPMQTGRHKWCFLKWTW